MHVIVWEGKDLNTKLLTIKTNPGVNLEPIIKTIYPIYFFISIFIKCFYYQFTTRISIRPFFSLDNILMMTATVCSITVVIGFILLFYERRKFLALCIANIIFSVLILSDTNFFRYYSGLITIPVISHIDFELVSSVEQSIMSLFKIKDIIYVIDIPFAIAGAVLLRKRLPPSDMKKRLIMSFGLILSGIAVLQPLRIRADIGSFYYNSSYVTKTLGVLYAHADTTRIFFGELLQRKHFTEGDKRKLDEFFDNKVTGLKSDYYGIAKGKNVIIIQVEALQQFVIGKKIDGVEITPNLNKLVKDSLYFDNYYCQVSGGNTSDAELLSNASLYPAREGVAYYRFPDNQYYTIAKALKEQGYNSYAFHAFRPDFYNRVEMYETLGFDDYFSCDDYKQDDFAGWEGNALSDESFFRQSLGLIDTSKPFYAFMITLSSHHPFTYFKDFPFNAGKFEGTYLGNYFKAINYTDKCIGQFIDRLKQEGLYEDSLIVLYGDHFAVPKQHADELMSFLSKSYSDVEWLKLQRVPCIIRSAGLEHKVNSTVGGEVDLFPTIANLLGINSSYALGKDLINEQEGYVVFRDGSVVTQDFLYLNNRREVYDYVSGKRLSIREFRNKLKQLSNELMISDIILGKDAFKYYKR